MAFVVVVLVVVVFFLLLSSWTIWYLTVAFLPPVRKVAHAPLAAGGFGGSNKKSKKPAVQKKLKPKQQWDRYLDMKKEIAKKVGVRLEDDEWLAVGKIRSKASEYTEQAVALQRALIAEVRRRG